MVQKMDAKMRTMKMALQRIKVERFRIRVMSNDPTLYLLHLPNNFSCWDLNERLSLEDVDAENKIAIEFLSGVLLMGFSINRGPPPSTNNNDGNDKILDK